MAGRPVRPRDAASLVVIRAGSGSGGEVLMGRREPRDRFMPDVYVFPGGRVDRSDAALAAASELSEDVHARVARASSPARARALAIAAVRETWEETGLAFGDVVDGQVMPELHHLDYVARAITPAGSAIRYHARFFLAKAEHGRGDVRGNGELLDLRWVALADVETLAVMDVTKLVLREAKRRVERPDTTGVARITYRMGKATVRHE